MTLVTNDSKSLAVTYLTGLLQTNQTRTVLTGDVKEYMSSRALVLSDGARELQPFSVRNTEASHIEIAKPNKLTIAWPGGGTTVSDLTCTFSRAYEWSYGSYSGLLTIREQGVR